MTIDISNNAARVNYTVASGVTQTSFSVPFEFFSNSDLNVYVDDVLKTITTHYTVSGGDGSTGTIGISVTGAAAGSTVVISRSIAIERTSDFQTGVDINRAALNTQLDIITAIASDNEDKASRAISAPNSEVDPVLVLPDVDGRKGRVLGFNATTGNVEAGPNISDVSSLAAITADIARLADIEDGTDATDAIQTVAGNSSNVTTVAGISANVTTVAGNTTNINTVAADGTDIGLVAGSIANVNLTGGSIGNVNTVATDLTGVDDIGTVADNLNGTNTIGTVAGSIANVNLTAGSIGNVNAVAAEPFKTNINNVASDATDIGTVAGKATEIGLLGTTQTVSDMTALAVQGVRDDMALLGPIAADITGVNNINSEVVSVYNNRVDITEVADWLDAGGGLYNDASVDLHLNKSTATTGEVLSWNGTDYDWVAPGAAGDLVASNNLSDLTNVPTARTNLGLGTAATTASTDYATSAQGTTADAALPKAGGALTGPVTTNSTFDGRDVSVDGAKLDGLAALELYSENYTTGTKPTSTGVNSVSIGLGATAGGTSAIALGQGATASSDYSVALGIGQVALNSDYAFAVGVASASGNSAVSIAINSTSSLRGATAANAFAQGHFNKATALKSTAIGGQNNIASGERSYVFGNTSTAGFADSIAIGHTVTASEALEIAIGGATNKVKINGAYVLPLADGTAGQFIKSDGNGVLSFATGSGSYTDASVDTHLNKSTATSGEVLSWSGTDYNWITGVGAALYATNESSPAAQPSATGVNAIAIGDSATSSGLRAFSVGVNNTSSGTDSVSLGRGNTSSGTGSFSLGESHNVSGDYSHAWGYGNTVTHDNSFAIGWNVQSTAASQISLGATTDTVRISERYTLPNVDGTNGQILVTNGSGALSFTNNTGSYSNTDVDAHLNISTATTGEVLSWTGTDYDWVAAGSGSGDLLAANNLSDLANAATARTNLGLGTAAITASTAYATSAQGTTADAALPKAGGTMSGNIVMPALGTVDGVDISVRDGVLSTTTTTANSALPKAGGTMTGNITMPALGTVDGRDLSVDGAKLDLIAASANNYVHPNHTGEVTSTGDGATVITDNVVDEANLKVSNAPTDGYVLSAQSGNTGGLTWVASGGGSSYTDADVDTHLNKSTATTGEVLSWSGTDYDWIAAGGGGGASAISINIKTADYTVVAGDLGKIIKYVGAGADRTVTLTAGATLGDGFYVTISNANGGADERVVIDPSGTEKFGWSNGPQTITLSRGEMVKIVWDNTNSCWIIGEGGFNLAIRNDINPANSVLVGDGTNAGFAAGYDAQATGSVSVALGRGVATGGTSVALGKGYASGSDSFAAAIADSTSSYGATSTGSIAIGKQAKSTGSYGTAIGEATQATASNSVCMGYYSQATGQGAVAIGYDAQATAGKSYSFGLKVRNAIQNTFRFAGGHFSAAGDAQSGIYIMRSDTTDATPEALTTTKTAASTDNQVILPDNSAYFFSGTIIAREQASAGTDVGAWEIKGAIRRETGVASTVLINSTINDFNVPTGWAVALTADTTNGGLAITVTGAAATNIRWVGSVTTSEVTY